MPSGISSGSRKNRGDTRTAPPADGPDRIREIANRFRESRILLTAFELDLFTALASGGATSAQAAAQIGADARAVDRLLNALCAIGLVKKRGTKFSLPKGAANYLVRGRRGYQSGLMHTVHLWETWSTLTEAVRRGTCVPRPGVNDRGDRWLTAFISAMHERASAVAPKAVSLLDLEGVSSVLDVGGGSGAFAMAFARARKNLTATVFDLPNVIPLARRYVSESGLEGRIEFKTGDYLTDELGTGFDLVFLSAIVHSNSPEENGGLIGKCAGAVRSGGRVVVQDWVMDESRTSPAGGAFFALNMLVGTDAGDTYTGKEIRRWMKEAGLGRFRQNNLPSGVSQLIGVKV